MKKHELNIRIAPRMGNCKCGATISSNIFPQHAARFGNRTSRKKKEAGVTGRQRPCVGSGGERSVCGMSGRPNAAAPQCFAEFLRGPYTGMSAPRKVVFSANAKPTASEVANGDGSIISKPTFRLARGGGYGGETPSAPIPVRIQYSVAEIRLNPSSTAAQAVEKPIFSEKTSVKIGLYQFPRGGLQFRARGVILSA